MFIVDIWDLKPQSVQQFIPSVFLTAAKDQSLKSEAFMVSTLVQVPSISGWAKFRADGAGVARRLNMLAFNMERHGVFVSGSMAAVSAPKPRVSWL